MNPQNHHRGAFTDCGSKNKAPSEFQLFSPADHLDSDFFERLITGQQPLVVQDTRRFFNPSHAGVVGTAIGVVGDSQAAKSRQSISKRLFHDSSDSSEPQFEFGPPNNNNNNSTNTFFMHSIHSSQQQQQPNYMHNHQKNPSISTIYAQTTQKQERTYLMESYHSSRNLFDSQLQLASQSSSSSSTNSNQQSQSPSQNLYHNQQQLQLQQQQQQSNQKLLQQQDDQTISLNRKPTNMQYRPLNRIPFFTEDTSSTLNSKSSSSGQSVEQQEASNRVMKAGFPTQQAGNSTTTTTTPSGTVMYVRKRKATEEESVDKSSVTPAAAATVSTTTMPSSSTNQTSQTLNFNRFQKSSSSTSTTKMQQLMRVQQPFKTMNNKENSMNSSHSSSSSSSTTTNHNNNSIFSALTDLQSNQTVSQTSVIISSNTATTAPTILSEDIITQSSSEAATAAVGESKRVPLRLSAKKDPLTQKVVSSYSAAFVPLRVQQRQEQPIIAPQPNRMSEQVSSSTTSSSSSLSSAYTSSAHPTSSSPEAIDEAHPIPHKRFYSSLSSSSNSSVDVDNNFPSLPFGVPKLSQNQCSDLQGGINKSNNMTFLAGTPAYKPLQTPIRKQLILSSSTKKQQFLQSSSQQPFGKVLKYGEEQQLQQQPKQGSCFTPATPAAAPAGMFETPMKEGEDKNVDYGFNSPMYTPKTCGKLLPKIKESNYENTPIDEFKMQFANKIKMLRSQLKDNMKSPDAHSATSSMTNTPITAAAAAATAGPLQQQPQKGTTDKGEKQSKFLEFLVSRVEKIANLKPIYYWTVVFEIADYAKKECLYHEAKYFYSMAIGLQPFCADLWLEYAKMEEDYGNLQKAKDLLYKAYPFCKMSDSLILKLLRIIEKIGEVKEMRALLSNLSSMKLEKSWKFYIEGAQMEIRFGNIKNAERILKMLHNYLSLNGQICYEYARVLELQGNLFQAIQVCWQAQEKGLKCTSIWTLYLKLYEKAYEKIDGQTIDRFVRLANMYLSKDILWKIHLDIASICEKKNEIGMAKRHLIASAKSVHESMRWKPVMQMAKLELLYGSNPSQAHYLISKSLESCADKQRPFLMIEAAKCAEFIVDIPKALSNMKSLHPQMQSEWKIYMEYISMLIRNKQHKAAKEVILESLNTHTLAGRLWGELIQLEHIRAKERNPYNLDTAFECFLLALEEVPKSGEVWCEGARLCMNPYGNKFDLAKAKQFLEYAIFFTPQYGDSFVEAMRLDLIQGDRTSLKSLKSKMIIAQPNYGHLWYFIKDSIRDSSIDVWHRAKVLLKEELRQNFSLYQKRVSAFDLAGNTENSFIPLITALNSYNELFYDTSTMNASLRWKVIFFLDQSLNTL